MKPERQFTQVLAELRGGLVQIELTKELAEVVEAVQESGRPGSLSVKLTLRPKGKANREIHVAATYSSKRPPAPDTEEPSIFFADRGALVRDDPMQRELLPRGPRAVDHGKADGSSPAEQQAAAGGDIE